MAAAPPQQPQPEDEIKVLPMQISDLPQVMAIENASFPAPWSRQAFISELTYNRSAVYLVAKADDQVVGYSGLWLVVDEAHITNIAVHPRWRRRGIGKILMDEMQNRALARKCRAITLEVRKSNTAAQKLYTQYGFTAQGIRRGYYSDSGEDAIIMWKYMGDQL